MISSGGILLVDTNAMIEALRVKCWKAISTFYRIETAERCIAELGTGPKADQESVELVRKTALVHAVSQVQRIALMQRYSMADLLDSGERDLLAHALARADAWFLCGPDKATLRALQALGLLARAVSLEKLARVAGARGNDQFKDNYRERWLSQQRVRLQSSA